MIKIVLEDNEYCPQVFCDHCGKRIEGSGNYQWRMNLENCEPATGEIFFTHKQCCRAFDNANGGRIVWYWEELRKLPDYLKVNLGVKHGQEEAIQRAR